ncbi:YciI family protein [Nitratireductor pacificus]|uniref:DGPFAETKE domain-containing protein n=1 Tax=Nitratireductor pacificus pht-3B TaxID=391937 RepID=K2M8T5_9HYPH|nr:YciI family protein [Nitratireductor pacificus]EKF17425.1 DGPFAETKE domain-containing protein [Nitratireductor pacificus pht-3B]
MRYMMLMIPKGYETAGPELDLPADAVAAMMKYNEELSAAGILVALEGLHPPSTGARVSFASGEPVVIDGPFIEAKEVVGGFWIIDVPTLADAIEWAKRCPGSPSETIEVRKIQEMDDYSDPVREVVEAHPAVLEKGIGNR